MSQNNSTSHLTDFLKAGVSPYHTVNHAEEEQLKAAGLQL